MHIIKHSLQSSSRESYVEVMSVTDGGGGGGGGGYDDDDDDDDYYDDDSSFLQLLIKG